MSSAQQAVNPAPQSAGASFAASLGVAPEDLPQVGAAFSAMMSSVGIDGKAVFERLSQGKSLAAALSVPPGANAVLYARAHSWFAIGRPEKAAILFRGLCALAGDVADYWVGLGVCLKAQGRCEDAKRALETAATRRPDWALPYFHLAECFMRTGDRERARAAIDAFDARCDDHTPAPLRVEADRYRAALQVHSSSPGEGKPVA